MNILITNDDGIKAVGIRVLVDRLKDRHNILIVAPDKQRSASSHSITLTDPIIVKKESINEVTENCYSVSGTPVDCTKIALTTLAKDQIDIVISGVNDGFNLGTDVLYSGTVSAAVEGAINNVPAIAVSCDGKEESFNIALEYIDIILDKVKNYDLKDTVLNVNIPSVKASEVKGMKVCRIGERSYDNVYIVIGEEEGKSIYKITGSIQPPKENDTDVAFIEQGYVTVTPLKYDLTYNHLMEDITNVLR